MGLEHKSHKKNKQEQEVFRLFVNHFEIYGQSEDFFQREKECEGLIPEVKVKKMYNIYEYPLKKRM